MKNISHWSKGKIPKNNAFFAIGDVHGEWQLLVKLIKIIKKKIYILPKNTKIFIIFLGDYIDRGLDSKICVNILSNLKIENIKIIFLCGNHDEIFKRIISCEGVKNFKECKLKSYREYEELVSDNNNYLYAQGLLKWLHIGGGMKTILDYCPMLKNGFIHNLKLNTTIDNKILKNIFEEILILKKSIPLKHKQFFSSIYKNSHFLIGDYLFTHAGINPNISILEQGIGKNSKTLSDYEYIEFLMIRDKFLWRDNLENCPYYVIHGHTPSEIKVKNSIIADYRKNYRVCIDTSIYTKDGTITCFYGYNDNYNFISVNKNKRNFLLNY